MTRTLSAAGGAQPDVDKNIRTVTNMLLAAQDQPKATAQAELAVRLGWSRSVAYSRLGGQTSFTAAEVAALAEHFDVPVSAFFGGPGELLGRRNAGITDDKFPTLDDVSDDLGQAA
jgi:transcriptional regulator with XRE-family HTH domain